MVFQQNVLEKAYFTAKMSGQAIVRPASSDFWKAPYVGITRITFAQKWLRWTLKLATE